MEPKHVDDDLLAWTNFLIAKEPKEKLIPFM